MIDARPYQLMLTRLMEDGANESEMARRIGFSNTALRYIRSGRTRSIRIETANAIAALLERVS